MTSPPESITVNCPLCGCEYQDWWRPSVNLDLEDFDPAYLEECSSATCPRCGLRVPLATLTVQDGVFLLGSDRASASALGKVRLYELAYACRLYADVTDYDQAVDELRAATPGGVDLEVATHRSALLKWLNAWGCRQFAIAHHPMAARALRAWGRECLALLPAPGVSILAATETDLDRVIRAYVRLRALQVAVRHGRSTDYAVTCGPTGAAKILYALRPEALPPWDEPTRAAFRFDGTGESFRKYLVRVQATLRGVVGDAATHGLAADQIAAAIGRPGASLPKLLDEFYWVTVTRGMQPPTPDELAEWSRWATGSARPEVSLTA